MKWPSEVILIRHDVSAFNALREKKRDDPLYKEFLKEWGQDYTSGRTCVLATMMKEKYALGVDDADTPLKPRDGECRARQTAQRLMETHALPDVIFVSPYRRAAETFSRLQDGWPALTTARLYEEERIREQEHGLALLYNDWRVFYTFHPEQKKLHDLHKENAEYWYRYPQGENIPDVRDRVRTWFNTLTRDFAGKRVLAVTHHLTILSVRAHLERWSANEFCAMDSTDKPINCGVTVYEGVSDQGEDGRLIRRSYNQKLYD